MCLPFSFEFETGCPTAPKVFANPPVMNGSIRGFSRPRPTQRHAQSGDESLGRKPEGSPERSRHRGVFFAANRQWHQRVAVRDMPKVQPLQLGHLGRRHPFCE